MIEFQREAMLIVFILTCTALLIQIVYYLFIYSKFAFYHLKKEQSAKEPVSVILCARNEVKNLKRNLRSILEQDYDDFEVVVVNDCSWDESGEYLEQLEKESKHLKVVTLKEQEKYKHGKKFALTLGVKAAKNDLLLFTDADCMPAGKQWISNMQQRFHDETEIVLSYCGYNKLPGLLNKLIRFDTFFVALQYFSASLVNQPYMGVGRNLAYRKSLFFRAKGFAKHNHLLSGDDDLFVNENANAHNTSIEVSPDSFTFSQSKETFGDWLKQKKRHLSTGIYYRFRDKVFLGGYWSSTVLFYAGLITLAFLRFNWQILLGAFLFRVILQTIIFSLSMKKLNEGDLIFLFPLLEILLIIIHPILILWNLLSPKQQWK